MSLPILQPDTAGPRETALAVLWQESSLQFYTFRNIVMQARLRRRFDLAPARLDGLRVVVPAGQVPDCDACEDVCCTGDNAVVLLRLRDIAALLDAGRPDLMTHERPPSPKAATWARREADGSVFASAFPVLRRDATGTCVALTEDRRCGLYPAWPLSCARYPYAYDRKNHVVFYAAGCRSTQIAPVSEAPLAVRRLVRATLDAYNARVRDVLLLAFAREPLRALGLLDHVRESELGF